MTNKPNELIRYLLEQDRDKLFDLSEHKEKRSRNANAYCWTLIGKIADVERLDKEIVYVDMLKHYGQSEIVSVLAHIDVSGYFKYYEEIGRAKLQGKEFIHYRVFKGSSEYNTKEMAILIDGVIQEAQQLDIDTITPAELERLKANWTINEKKA